MSGELYEVLGIAAGATAAEVKQAWRNKAKQHHPDTDRDNPDLEAEMKRINHAYSVLKDPERRQRYDETGFDGAISDVEKLMVEMFDGVLMAVCSGQFGDTDPIRLMRELISEERKDKRKLVGKAEDAVRRLEGVGKRLKMEKAGKSDPLGKHLANRIEAERETMASAGARIAACDLIGQRLEDYRWESGADNFFALRGELGRTFQEGIVMRWDTAGAGGGFGI